MATQKTFAVAGVSTFQDGTKIRFANDAARVKILIKNGHTAIELIDLPREMTKAEIAEHLTAINFANGRPAVEAAIADLSRKNRVKAVPKVSKATKTTAASAEAVAQ